jgi:hypothetical protein
MRKTLILLTATALFFASCNKGLEPPINKIYGLWKGTETRGGSDKIKNITFFFDGGGGLKYYGTHDTLNAVAGTGTYTVVNNIFTATYVGPNSSPEHRTLKGHINDLGDNLDGHYVFTENQSQKGIISVVRQ